MLTYSYYQPIMWYNVVQKNVEMIVCVRHGLVFLYPVISREFYTKPSLELTQKVAINLLGFSHTSIPRAYLESNKVKHLLSSNSAEENILLIRKVSKEWPN